MNETRGSVSRRYGYEFRKIDGEFARLTREYSIRGTVLVPRGETRIEVTCIGCFEWFPPSETFKSNCTHKYCRTCFNTIMETSFENNSAFPPRCCSQAITIDKIHPFITRELDQAYRKKQIEYETLDRTYCSNIACQVFIPPHPDESDVVHCQVCTERTCTRCKNPAHEGDCVPDKSLEELLSLGKKKGWRCCPKCRQMIERVTGCSHISKFTCLG
jgi:hypothetical protein